METKGIIIGLIIGSVVIGLGYGMTTSAQEFSLIPTNATNSTQTQPFEFLFNHNFTLNVPSQFPEITTTPPVQTLPVKDCSQFTKLSKLVKGFASLLSSVS